MKDSADGLMCMFRIAMDYVNIEYRRLMTAGDYRTKDFLLASDLIYPVWILALYTWCLTLAPYLDYDFFLKRAPKISIKTQLVVYNYSLLFSYVALGTRFSMLLGQSRYSLVCQPVGFGGVEDSIVTLFWYFHILKIVELMDNVFLTAAKVSVRLSVVYHHVSMVLISWVAMKYFPGGTGAILATINCWNHVALSAYYNTHLVVARSKHLKLLLNLLQIAQLVMVVSISLSTLVADCGYSKWASAFCIAYTSSLVVILIHAIMVKNRSRQ